MGEAKNSTIAFKSNLQLITAPTVREDKKFLASVRDPFALEIMNGERMYLTPVQEKEFRNASLHCSYAFKGDYPFGTIIDDNGRERAVCRCINTECPGFSTCRPDFDPEELKVSEGNNNFRTQVEKAKTVFLSEAEEMYSANAEQEEGDTEALAFLYSGTGEITNSSDKEPENPFNWLEEEPANENVAEDSDADFVPADEIPDASFASFETVEQDEIISMDPLERTIVNAGPGTGKTWTLIEKIKYMLTVCDVDPEDILVLCFSRAAVDVIRSRLKEAADRGELPMTWHMVDVRTFDSFSTYMLAWVSENMPELLPEKYVLEYQDYDSRISTATSVFKHEPDMLAEYTHVIVDEVQDLVGVRAELVLALLESLPESCGFTLLGDSCQALYDYMSEDHPEILSSNDFYEQLFHEFRNAHFYAFDVNHRQDDELENLTVPYREAILSGNAQNRLREASALCDEIKTSETDIRYFSASDAEEYTRNGNLGILTRTNGQALQISSWLRNEGVGHTLQRRSENGNLAYWISRIIFNAKTEVLGRKEFSEIFSDLYPENASDAGLYWEALTSSQKDSTKNYYEIEDLLRGLLKNARNPLLFKEPQNSRPAKITVSSIHRAKGREFDAVLVPEDVIIPEDEPEKDKELEHKVCYVALTRPKKRLEKIKLGTQYIYIMKDETRRCFKSGGFRRKTYLSHFEVGAADDLNERSFALSEERQNEIRETIKNGTRLKLLKRPEEAGKPVIYSLVPEDREKEVLGYTTKKFYYAMESAIQKIYKNSRHIAYKYFPNRFGDIYAEGLTTCISSDGKGIDGARQFGSMYIWNGISVEGFAQMEKDRY